MNYARKSSFNDVIETVIIDYLPMNGVIASNTLVGIRLKSLVRYRTFSSAVLPCELHNYDFDRAFWNHSVEGIFRPQCTSEGYYAPRQCNTDTPRECWCVDKHGIEVEGTRNDDDHMPECGK